MGFQCQFYEKSHSSNSSARQTIQILSGNDHDHDDDNDDDDDHDGNDDDDEILLNKQLGKANHANIVRLAMAMVMVMMMMLVMVMVMGLLLMVNQSIDPISPEVFSEYILEHGIEFEDDPIRKIINI